MLAFVIWYALLRQYVQCVSKTMQQIFKWKKLGFFDGQSCWNFACKYLYYIRIHIISQKIAADGQRKRGSECEHCEWIIDLDFHYPRLSTDCISQREISIEKVRPASFFLSFSSSDHCFFLLWFVDIPVRLKVRSVGHCTWALIKTWIILWSK